ncbi:tyrosine-type recombinase/integrase [Actinospica sp.]|jgi:site-specific recombinase XerD|uniref:tyrosine-type recombinase/integrase n=1 Tax=Actinospica sp. TaxID=1872142 RepID=UPI0032C23912
MDGRSHGCSLLDRQEVVTPRIHDVRHSAETPALERGVDIRVVQEIIGHSSLSVTRWYAHVTSRLAQEAAERIGNALWS